MNGCYSAFFFLLLFCFGWIPGTFETMTELVRLHEDVVIFSGSHLASTGI